MRTRREIEAEEAGYEPDGPSCDCDCDREAGDECEECDTTCAPCDGTGEASYTGRSCSYCRGTGVRRDR